MKKIIFLLAIIAITLASCEKDEENQIINTQNQTEEDIKIKNFAKFIIGATVSTSTVNDVHKFVERSIEYGLDESLFTDDVLSPSSKNKINTEGIYSYMHTKLKAKNYDALNESLSYNGIAIYWPYSEKWDGVSSPVITFYPENKEYKGEKIIAYKAITENNKIIIDSILIDEEYSIKNPVWIIKTSDLSSVDLDCIFNGLPTFDGRLFVPRNPNILKTKSNQKAISTDLVAETKIVSIQSTIQHDTWVNGGSEYIVYWFFPVADFGLSHHKTNQIILSRNEINASTIRNINWDANFDWFSGQSHNRVKIIEFDPGENQDVEIKFTTALKPKDSIVTVSGEFKTTITLNKNDEMIMDKTIPRTAMLTTETQVSQNYFEKSFTDSGVTVVASIRGIEGVEL